MFDILWKEALALAKDMVRPVVMTPSIMRQVLHS